MTRTRASAALAMSTMLVGSTLTTPIAHADDPLAPIRAEVNSERGYSTCGPLNYSIALEGEAQAAIGNDLPGVPPAGKYNGSFRLFFGGGDPEEKAIAWAIGSSGNSLKDCKYKDYGVGFYRIDQIPQDKVAIALGEPPAPAPAPKPETKPNPNPATVSAPPVEPTLPAPAAAPVTNAISLSFVPPHLGSITATVKNSSDLTAKCTYDASGITKTHRDFTVSPHGSTDLTFNGVNTGTSYHVVVSCHDASGKQTQEIGHAETDVTF